MENKTKRPGAGFRFAVLSALLLLAAGPVAVKAQFVGEKDTLIIDRVVAVVGKYPVLQSDIENQLNQMRSQGVTIPGENPRCTILESLLMNKLLVTQAEIDSVEVTDEEVQRTVDQKLQMFMYQAGGQENLENILKKPLLEIKKDLFKPQKEAMIADKMRSQITSKVTITPSEVQKYFRQIPSDEIPLRPATMEVREITLQPMVTPQEIERVQNKLKEYRDRIMKGESFTTLAVLYSDDKASAVQGGEMDNVQRSQLVPEFAAVVFNLKPGEISRVVKTEYGYHIIQLLDRKGDVVSFKHILLIPKPTDQAKQDVRQRLDSIATLIRENKMSFEEAAVKYSASKDTRANGGLLVNNGNPEVPNSDNINTTWFTPQELDPDVFNAIRNLKVGEISKVIESKDQSNNLVYKILSIKTSRPAHRANLKQDYQFLQTAALNDKKEKVLNDWIDKKQETMYIKIDPDFQGCEFEHKGWVK